MNIFHVDLVSMTFPCMCTTYTQLSQRKLSI